MVHRKHHRRIDRWLFTMSNPDEVSRSRFDDDWERLVVSVGVSACMSEDGFFRGVAVTDDTVRFQVAPESDDAWGTFVQAEHVASGWRVTRDLYGNVPLLATDDDGLSAASDSTLLLAELRRVLRLPLSLDAQNLRARSILDLTAAQTMGSHTHFQEIRAVAAGHPVRLERDRVVHETSRLTALEPGQADYTETVRAAAGQLVGLMGALGRLDGWTPELAMSGGMDSRTVLAAAHRAGADIAVTSGNATAAQARDYEVAKNIAREFGFSFGRTGPVQQEPSVADRLPRYGSFFAGMYDTVGGARTVPWHANTLYLTGIGPEAGKGMWGWRSWDQLADDVTGRDDHSTPHTRSAFRRIGKQALIEAGCDPDANDASENFYLLYRSGIHCGAGKLPTMMAFLTPLQAPLVTGAGRLIRSDRLVQDLTLLLSPGMAVAEYDKPGRNLSKADAEARLSELGGEVTSADSVALIGNADDVPRGASELSLNVALKHGFRGGSLQRVVRWFEEDVQRLPGDLADLYRDVYNNGVWMLGKVGGHVPAGAPSLGKAVGLRVLSPLG